MSAARLLLSVLVGLLPAACHVGPQIEQANLGRQPHGADVIVEMKAKAMARKPEHRGELLEVRDDGLVILTPKDATTDARIVLIPWTGIHRAKASDLPGIAVRTSQGETRRRASTDELRNVSRFPQGLSPGLTERLLARYGQSRLGTIE